MVTVFVVACIGFLNHVLLRLYGSKGIAYTAILGGFVNSTATAAELSSTLPAAAGGSHWLRVVEGFNVPRYKVAQCEFASLTKPHSGAMVKVPLPFPSMTSNVASSSSSYITARSGIPSALKSAAAI